MGTDTLKPASGNDLALAEDGGAAALTVEQNGNVTLETGNLIVGTAGQGIDFSQAQTPAAGMTAEILDSYEEGTWTAVITDGSNDATMSNTTCLYTKIGRLVTVSGAISVSSLGSVSGDISIKTLPFSVSNTTGNQSGCAIGYMWNGAIAQYASVSAYFWQGTSKIYLGLWDATTGATPFQGSELSADGQIIIGGSYMTDS